LGSKQAICAHVSLSSNPPALPLIFGAHARYAIMQLCAEFHYRRRPLFRKRLSSLPDEFRRESTIFLRALQSWNRARECAATSFVVVVVRTPNKLHILCQVKLNLTLCQVSRTLCKDGHLTRTIYRSFGKAHLLKEDQMAQQKIKPLPVAHWLGVRTTTTTKEVAAHSRARFHDREARKNIVDSRRNASGSEERRFRNSGRLR